MVQKSRLYATKRASLLGCDYNLSFLFLLQQEKYPLDTKQKYELLQLHLTLHASISHFFQQKVLIFSGFFKQRLARQFQARICLRSFTIYTRLSLTHLNFTDFFSHKFCGISVNFFDKTKNTNDFVEKSHSYNEISLCNKK